MSRENEAFGDEDWLAAENEEHDENYDEEYDENY